MFKGNEGGFREGQATIEFSLTLLLVVLPLVAGGTVWFWLEFNRSKCAYETLFRARRQMISLRSTSTLRASCGQGPKTVSEEVKWMALEELDQDKGGLGLSDLTGEVSLLWEQASRLLQQSQEAGSID